MTSWRYKIYLYVRASVINAFKVEYSSLLAAVSGETSIAEQAAFRSTTNIVVNDGSTQIAFYILNLSATASVVDGLLNLARSTFYGNLQIYTVFSVDEDDGDGVEGICVSSNSQNANMLVGAALSFTQAQVDLVATFPATASAPPEPPVTFEWKALADTALANAQLYPDMTELAMSDAADKVGRQFKQGIVACLLAFDATGDQDYYASAAGWVTTVLSLLQDHDDDGYREFRYTSNGLEGHNLLNDSLSNSTIALMMLWAHNSGDTELRDTCLDYLENDSIPQWSGVFPADNLTHPRLASVETGYCLYLVTGKQEYLERTTALWNDFLSVCETMDADGETALLWDHRCPITTTGLGFQLTNYFNYSATSIFTLHHIGFPGVSGTLLQQIEVTIRKLILADYPETIYDHMDGTGGDYSDTKAVVSNGFWLYAGISGGADGAIETVAQIINTREGGAPQNKLNLPACMVAAGF
jgi:hypothetical protein